MYLNIKYSFVEYNNEDLNLRKFVGWKSIGFKRKKGEDYSRYTLNVNIPFDWEHTHEVIDKAMSIIRQIYSSVHFINDYNFYICNQYCEAFTKAEDFIMRLRQAYVVYAGYRNPDTVFARKINAFTNLLNIERDLLSISIQEVSEPDPEKSIKKRPVLRDNYYVCPDCGEQVWKNFDGCTNCKRILDWSGID